MSDATVSRLGQVNVTGAVDALFLEVWSGEVLEAFNKKQTTADKHLVRTIANGKSAQFPILGTVGSAFHVAGTELSFQQVKHAKRSIAIDGLLVAPIFLDVLDEAQNHYDVRAPYQEQQGQTLANDWDQRVLRSFIIASRTATHPNTALPGGRRVTSATMGTSGTWATSISSLDSDLEPMAWIAPAGGPMKVIPTLAQASAKRAFSERNP